MDESATVMTWKLTRVTPEKMERVLSTAPVSRAEGYMLQAIQFC
ncbi:hypothetical protein SLEP1_g17415 [Rubroshorea leprosula]|uniref:Uncharacterized protein n=1 Tax=Rubroshorea leprosula TaxID=152421 RepID=A0AAV5J3A0_9ROSI|nr:hypothetical protein SLEP1_g17415 [Rubroshorea leprosula]